MRLIDADELKNAIRAESWKEDNTVKMAVEYINIIIDEQLTINPDELRPHGRWVHDHYENCTEQFEIVKCSNCGYTAYAMAFFVKSGNYCPNCGAKMDATDNNVGGKMDGSDERPDWQQSMLRTFGGDADV